MQLSLLPAAEPQRKRSRTSPRRRLRQIIPATWRLPLVTTARSACVGRFVAAFAQCTFPPARLWTRLQPIGRAARLFPAIPDPDASASADAWPAELTLPGWRCPGVLAFDGETWCADFPAVMAAIGPTGPRELLPLAVAQVITES
jgi:hypothetical protein